MFRLNHTFRDGLRFPARTLPARTGASRRAHGRFPRTLLLAAAILVAGCSRPDAAPTGVEPSFHLHTRPPAPVIARMEPATAGPGASVVIQGQNLRPSGSYFAPSVRFGRELALVTASSNTSVTVAVPAGRGTVDVTVETIGGTSAPVRFTYKAPRITLVNPSHGPPGEIVGVAGDGFGVKMGGVSSYLTFGRTVVHPQSWSERVIVARAPDDMGTGNTSEIFFGLGGCVSRASLFVRLWMPGCRDLVNAAIRRLGLKRNGDYLEHTVPVVVHTSVGSSNAGYFMFRLRMENAPSAPAVTGYTWDRAPVAGQPFNGTVTGSNFVTAATQVYFCVAGTSTCYPHPSAGVSVTGATTLTVRGVNLGTGSWQVYVSTAGGASARSSPFAVSPPPPTLSGYAWDRAPAGTQPFNGTLTGSNFVAGGTRVYFCVAGTSTCYEHPGAGVSVTSPRELRVYNVRLSSGGWQVYVATNAGASPRSSTFPVR